MRPILMALTLLLTACASFPEVDRAEAGLVTGPAPVLLPTDQIEAAIAASRRPAPDPAALTARAAALRARAADLRQP